MPESLTYHGAPGLVTGSFTRSCALAVATMLVNTICPFCETLPNGQPAIAIAGSIRRRKPFVNDIDLVVIPKYEFMCDDSSRPNELEQKLSALCLEGILSPEFNGRKVKRYLIRDCPPYLRGSAIPVDIFIATRKSWWTQLLIRTGSREHNIELGMRAQHLRMQLRADGGGLLSPGGEAMSVNSEIEIFNHLMLPYKPPIERD